MHPPWTSWQVGEPRLVQPWASWQDVVQKVRASWQVLVQLWASWQDVVQKVRASWQIGAPRNSITAAIS